MLYGLRIRNRTEAEAHRALTGYIFLTARRVLYANFCIVSQRKVMITLFTRKNFQSDLIIFLTANFLLIRVMAFFARQHQTVWRQFMRGGQWTQVSGLKKPGGKKRKYL